MNIDYKPLPRWKFIVLFIPMLIVFGIFYMSCKIDDWFSDNDWRTARCQRRRDWFP